MSKIEESVAVARIARDAGAATESILDGILTSLGDELKPFTFIAVLRQAFGVPVRTLREVENWERIDDRGNITTSEVVSLLRRWVEGPQAELGD